MHQLTTRALALAFAICTGFAGSAAYGTPALSSDDSAPAFQFPPMPSAPVPPDRPSFGLTPPKLGNSVRNPGVTTPLVQSDQAKKAPDDTPAHSASRADVLNELFQRLSSASDSSEAGSIAVAIERLWLQSDSDTADLLMVRTVTAVSKGNLDLAGQLLDKIVAIDPDWAEAWNKRATLRFLNGDDAGAMEDISHVLALEPRHFGALSGMGFILQRNGMKKEALALIKKAAAIYPHNAELEKVVSGLTLEVEGRDI